MISIEAFTFNPFSENTYVLYDETREAVIIDPGCYERVEQEELAAFIEEKELKIKFLLNTHCHIDHVLWNEFVKRKYNVPFLIHPTEVAVLKAVKAYAPNYGFPNYHEALSDGELKEGTSVHFGSSTLETLFLPGHSPGHVGFYEPKQKFLVTGDVLFYHSVGRTDLPGGNSNTLLDSIHRKLFVLPDDVTVYSGHGGTTTLGEEKIHNPYCAIRV
jgi:glyoxylase-like metal-dependent hydrolase (beta-lactamase superfamily II)